MRARQVGITDTTLRDGHQSLWATRMHTSEMIPVLELMDSIGFHSLECWGGATFDASLRFLDEDPWERLRLIKKHVVRTPLQMLLRGQNLVGYRHYGDDIVRRFVYKAAENGMDIFRVFDALNDIRNFETAAAAIKETGKHFQGAVVYTISPVHSLDHYVDVAHRLVDMGADSICIKDMAALLSPFYAEQLVGRLKAELSVPIQLHCHYIGGLAPMTYLKAIEAGVDVIDTATVPLAFGNSQPATEMVVSALTGTPYDSGLDLEKLFEMAKYFEKVRQEGGWDRGVTSLTHMQVYSHQVPGGMISNLESQLKEQSALDRLPEVLEEIPIVRAEVGFPPLVTPMSQIVGTQAVLNVLSGTPLAHRAGRDEAVPARQVRRRAGSRLPRGAHARAGGRGAHRRAPGRPRSTRRSRTTAPRSASWRAPRRTCSATRCSRRRRASTSSGITSAPSPTSSASTTSTSARSPAPPCSSRAPTASRTSSA